jgi:hypothetical protein
LGVLRELRDTRIEVAIMSRVLCLEPGCNETVELPGDTPVAVIEEYLPPREREIEVICPRGHRKIYVLNS